MDEQMPTHYMICLNSACPHAGNCLRQLYSMKYPADSVSVHALNPQLYPKEGEKCAHFRLNRKIRLAWGIEETLRELPHQRAKDIKHDLISHFGKTRYYRFSSEKIPLTPAEQSAVQEIFRHNGTDTEPAYKRHTEALDW